MSIGKMTKHKEMARHSLLRRHLPETHWLSASRTKRMIRTYKSIFVKPNHGSGGTGIIRAKRLRKGRYEVRYGKKYKYVKRSHYVYKAIKAYPKQNDSYIVQRGVKLAKYDGTIFDARIYMQKPEDEWVIAGMSARVAAKHRYVTNYHQGGYGKPLTDVLQSVFSSKSKTKSCLRKIMKLSYKIAATLDKHHSLRELGIDVGIEKSGRVWIIEANSKPGHMLFTQLPSKTMLNRIIENKQKIYRGNDT